MPQMNAETEAQLAARKATLRKEIRRLREDQPASRAADLSLRAQKHLLAAPCWQEAASVAMYVALKGELSTALLLEKAWEQGKDVWLPRVHADRAGHMEFVLCDGPQRLRRGPFGLMEPEDSLQGAGPQDAGGRFAPDVLVLPGVAFDRRGGRVGFGGGYYDRFLSAPLPGTRVGLCFGFQVREALPLEAWDQRVHALCTEGGLLWL